MDDLTKDGVEKILCSFLESVRELAPLSRNGKERSYPLEARRQLKYDQESDLENILPILDQLISIGDLAQRRVDNWPLFCARIDANDSQQLRKFRELADDIDHEQRVLGDLLTKVPSAWPDDAQNLVSEGRWTGLRGRKPLKPREAISTIREWEMQEDPTQEFEKYTESEKDALLNIQDELHKAYRLRYLLPKLSDAYLLIKGLVPTNFKGSSTPPLPVPPTRSSDPVKSTNALVNDTHKIDESGETGKTDETNNTDETSKTDEWIKV